MTDDRTNPAAYYPHDGDPLLPMWKHVRIAIRANRHDPQTVVGFRPHEVTTDP